MEPLRTEEDQIRAIKQWWDDNGSSTLIGIGLAIAIVFGWQWWQQRTAQRMEQAAVLYRQLLQATALAADDPVQRTTAEHLANQLKTEQAGRRHGDYGAMILARLLVEKNDLAGAEKELRALLESQPDQLAGRVERFVSGLLGRHRDPQVGALARLRLARVLFALDRHDDALALLDDAPTDAFAIDRAELRGDILRAKGDLASAGAAYAEAIEKSGNAPAGLLELKQQDVAAVTPAAASTASVADEAAKPAATPPSTGGTNP